MSASVDLTSLSFSRCLHVWRLVFITHHVLVQGKSMPIETGNKKPRGWMQQTMVASETMEGHPLLCEMRQGLK